MEFPQQFPSLTIPTGAGPGQERITINENQDGAILVYGATGLLLVSIASAAGVDSEGNAYQAGVTTYGTNTTINMLQDDIVLTAQNGSKAILESGTNASLFLTPDQTTGPFFAGAVNTTIGGGNHPGIELASPTDNVNGNIASIILEGSSTASSSTVILGSASTFNMNALCQFGNVQVGHVTITPSAANTPTLATVNYSALKGSSFRGFVAANTTLPGTQVTGVSITNITSTSADIYLTRTNTTATGIDYMVWGV